MLLRTSRLLIATALLFAILPRSVASSPLNVTFLDVGQGDSIWVHAPDGTDLLVDGGDTGEGAVVRDYLLAHGDGHIEDVLLTHPHSDHCGGLLTVLVDIPVDRVWYNGEAYDSSTYASFLYLAGARLETLRAGDVRAVGPATLTVLAPSSLGSDANNNSIVCRLSYGSFDVMLEGDAQAESEHDMLYSGHPLGALRAEILKVAHHGSDTSSTPLFLETVHPQVAVISVGAHNSYGHPSPSTLDSLATVGATVYRTDLDGTVRIVSDGQTYSVYTDDQPEPTATATAQVNALAFLPAISIAHEGPSATATATPSGTPSRTPTATATLAIIPTVTTTRTATQTGTSTPLPSDTPTPTYTTTHTPTATGTPTRTASPTVTRTPPTSGEVNVTAWVSDETPARYTDVTTYGRITQGGVGIANVPMHAVWHYKTTSPTCDGTSGSTGQASCTRYIAGATAGYYVRVDVTFTYNGQSYTAYTGFTPH